MVVASSLDPKGMKVLVSALILTATLIVGGLIARATGAGGSADRGTSRTVPDEGLPISGDPEVLLGDRLFFESRFAQYFLAHSGGDVNAPLAVGDPVMDAMPELAGTSLLGQPLVGKFRGQSMNCRNCHLGDDFLYQQPMAGRTYVDFSTRSPIPDRNDGHVQTPRNSPLMINLGLPREVPMLLHFDGEFATVEDLVIGALTGRNFGWLPTETSTAVKHIARVIREDEGANPRLLKQGYGSGIPYRALFLGTDGSLPPGAVIPWQYRIDVMKASDEQVLMAIARAIHAYIDALRFGSKNTNHQADSPYDLFLAKNDLPVWSAEGETDLEYAQALLQEIEQRRSFAWIKPPADGEFELHRQTYEFGPKELEGLKIFLTRGGPGKSHAGNCVACHTPPQFTDYRLHNNGVAQTEYDAVFGHGAFAALEIPGLAERNARFDEFLPASPQHPSASDRFRSPPSAGRPGHADLGVWNVYGNPDMPKPQAALAQILCEPSGAGTPSCTPEDVLPRTIATFKTPSIRDLGQSNPYFHSGGMDTIEDVLRFYVTTSNLARAGEVRNASPELSEVRIDVTDIAPLAAFLRSLNEDYH